MQNYLSILKKIEENINRKIDGPSFTDHVWYGPGPTYNIKENKIFGLNIDCSFLENFPDLICELTDLRRIL